MRALTAGQTVHLTKVAPGGTGDLSVSETHTAVPAHVDFRAVTRRTGKSRDVVAKAVVYLRDDCPADLEGAGWRVETGGTIYQVLDVWWVKDPRTGVLHHLEVSIA